MKKITNYIKVGVFALIIMFFAGCDDMLNLNPTVDITDAAVWNKPSDFALGTNKFYEYLPKVMNAQNNDDTKKIYNTRDGLMHRDLDADLISNFVSNTVISRSAIGEDDAYNRQMYRSFFSRMRQINFLLERADAYTDKAAIAQYVGESYFFRAFSSYLHFRDFGPAVIVKTVLDVDSEELTAARASRIDFFNWMIEDLKTAENLLTANANLTTENKGRITKEAAQALMARLYLFEAAWQKYHFGNIAKNGENKSFFTLAAESAKLVIDGNQFALFRNASMGNDSYRWMFILESSAQCNPYKVLKSANKEYILCNRFDETIRQSGNNISHTAQSYYATKKMVEMYLDINGLPVSEQNYSDWDSFLNNRDPRLKNSVGYIGQQVWSYGSNGRVDWTGGNADKATQMFVTGDKKAFRNLKWVTERNMNVTEDGYDVPVIRLAEMYLTYAEAVYEDKGAITDEQLEYSLNKVRERVGMPDLTNAFVSANGLNMLTEIRRERAVEFYMEGLRLDDLRRWKQAEVEMSADIEGLPYLYKGVSTIFATKSKKFELKNADGVSYLNSRGTALVTYTYKKTSDAVKTYDDGSQYVLFEPSSNRQFKTHNYYRPIPYEEFDMNPNLEPNPGWEK